jgi:hypothetical protein
MRVFLCSPLAAREGRSMEDNVLLARKLCKAIADMGHAVFAPHLFYPQFMSEASERDKGIGFGKEWLSVADEIWVYDRLGISEGMRQELKYASLIAKPVNKRALLGVLP